MDFIQQLSFIVHIEKPNLILFRTEQTYILLIFFEFCHSSIKVHMKPCNVKVLTYSPPIKTCIYCPQKNGNVIKANANTKSNNIKHSEKVGKLVVCFSWIDVFMRLVLNR